MAIITISRGSYSKGKEVAEKVAAQLGYRCLSREVILDASDRYHIPEIKMVKAIHDAPSILERFGHSKPLFVAYYQSALTRNVQKDNVVYHGLAGHLLLKGVPHVLKVRIIADLSDRVQSEMEREGISNQKAQALILRDDEERRKWTQSLYGVDPWDSSLYDMIFHIQKFTVDDAVHFICKAVDKKEFKTTKKSQQKMDDLALASQIKAALVVVSPNIAVTSHYGNVLIYTKAEDRIVRKLEKKARSIRDEIKGIKTFEIHPARKLPTSAI
jgi:cytidylate kinase